MRRHQFLSASLAAIALFNTAAPTARAAATLEPASTAQLQALLAVPSHQMHVVFANHSPPRIPSNTFDRLFMWNEVALDTTAIDHTPVQPGEQRVFGEQFGPHRSSRAMAIVHIAMFEAENAVTQRFQSYAHVAPRHRGRLHRLRNRAGRARYACLALSLPGGAAGRDHGGGCGAHPR